jgi:hypothetical protein
MYKGFCELLTSITFYDIILLSPPKERFMGKKGTIIQHNGTVDTLCWVITVVLLVGALVPNVPFLRDLTGIYSWTKFFANVLGL